MSRTTAWLRDTWQRLLSENTSPVQLGVAVGVGVFFACTPFYGFQLWLALAVAWLFRLNKLAVAIGTQFSFPPLIPFIVFASAWTGEWIVHRRSLTMSLAQLQSAGAGDIARQIGVAWLVGGVVVGVVAGAITGALVTVVARRRARKASPSEAPARPSGPAA
jgi:uncharacterized protein (DUF2062 family)